MQLTLMTSNVPATLFDYAALDRETEVAARSDAALIKGLMRRTAEDVIEIGEALIRQQDALPQVFRAWIEAEFAMSRATAYNFIRVAKKFGGDKRPIIAHLPKLALYELASPSTPEEVRAEVERRIIAGELVSGEDVRTLKAQFREISDKALDLARTTDAIKEENRDLMANAHRKASEEAERRYGPLIDNLQKRVALAEETAAASIQAARADTAGAVIVPFAPRESAEDIAEADPLGADDVDDADLNDHRVGAHIIYGSLSSIDLAKTTPEVFWALFGTPNGKAGTKKWLLSTIKKLNAISKGMPK